MGRKAIRAAFARSKGGLLVMEARANLRQTHLPYIRQELPVSSGLLSEISQSIRMARRCCRIPAYESTPAVSGVFVRQLNRQKA